LCFCSRVLSLFPLPVLKHTVSNVAEGWGTAGSNAQADGEAAPGESAEAGAKLDQLASQVCLLLLFSYTRLKIHPAPYNLGSQFVLTWSISPKP